MNKRGDGEEESIFTASEIVVIVIYFGVLFFVTTNFDYISRVNEVYAEHDINLMAQVISSSPNNIEYNYPVKEIYSVVIEENKINILRSGANIADYYGFYNITLKQSNNKLLIT